VGIDAAEDIRKKIMKENVCPPKRAYEQISEIPNPGWYNAGLWRPINQTGLGTSVP